MASNPYPKHKGSEESTFDPDETLSADELDLAETILADTIEPGPPLEDEMPEDSSSSRTLSVLGPGLTIIGKLSAKEDLLIQGRIEGSIKHTATNLTIGAHGDVKANISANRVIVQGSVQGDIRAKQSVVVETSAQVRGNIFAPRVGLKEGAKFKGDIDMGLDAEELKAPESGRNAKKRTKASSRAKTSGRRHAKRDGDAGELTDEEVNQVLD